MTIFKAIVANIQTNTKLLIHILIIEPPFKGITKREEDKKKHINFQLILIKLRMIMSL